MSSFSWGSSLKLNGSAAIIFMFTVAYCNVVLRDVICTSVLIQPWFSGIRSLTQTWKAWVTSMISWPDVQIKVSKYNCISRSSITFHELLKWNFVGLLIHDLNGILKATWIYEIQNGIQKARSRYEYSWLQFIFPLRIQCPCGYGQAYQAKTNAPPLCKRHFPMHVLKDVFNMTLDKAYSSLSHSILNKAFWI